MPRTVSASEAKNRLGAILGWVLEHQDEVVVESRGSPAVVILPYAQYEEIRALREGERRREALERMRGLRERVESHNRDLTPEQGDALAERFARELVDDMARAGKVRFERGRV